MEQVQEDPNGASPILWGNAEGHPRGTAQPICVTHEPPAPPEGWCIGHVVHLEWWYYYTDHRNPGHSRRQYLHPALNKIFATRARPVEGVSGADKEYHALSSKLRHFLFMAGEDDGTGRAVP